MANKVMFGALLGRLVRTVSRLERDEVCCGDLTFQQFESLRKVEEAGRVNLSTLATALGIDQSTASRSLTRLERDGYLSKTRHGADARSLVVQLTGKGRMALSTMSCDQRDAFGALYDRIPPAERASVIAALSVLAGALPREVPVACCAPEPRRKAAV